jgi:outer membrane lipoprotein SlyB
MTIGRASWSLAALSAFLLTACATAPPARQTTAAPSVFPQRGQTAAEQSADIAACEQVAEDQAGRWGETAKGAAVGGGVGALGGAAAGAALGAITGGDVGRSAGIGAGVGGVGGAAYGGVRQHGRAGEEYDRAFRACMIQRGYGVSR